MSLFGEALEPPLAKGYEARGILLAKRSHEFGDKNTAGLGFATQPGRELHRCAEQVVVLGDRFAGMNADPNAQALRGLGVVSGKAPLDVGGGAHGGRYLVEGRPDAVA